MTLVSDITTKNWSMSADTQGAVVTNIDDINQCILLILKTVRRTDPLRPLFGCGLWEYVDKPVNVAIPNMIREIGISIETYEPRATITKITFQILISEVVFSIYWTSSFGPSLTTLNVKI